MLNKSHEKIPKYDCEYCKTKTNNKKDYNKHLLTRKHQNNLLLTSVNAPSDPATPLHICSNCDKKYKSRVGLWYHAKTCLSPKMGEMDLAVDRILNENQELRNFILEQSRVLTEQRKETSEIMNKVIEMVKPGITTINNNIKNENKSFNINVFLNEQCKDAINFTDFIKNIEISHQDLENNAQLGFVNGISKIFLDNLKQLGVNERPFHCTDAKRETMYIKDENSWQKQTDDEKLQKAIQTVSYRSMGKLQEWKQENPEYQDLDSEFSKKCMDIHKQSIAGSDREVYYPKVIHVLAKETMVDK